jgi:predicted AlkP superfamily pyrophosphatase or phosphodiesterase
VIERYVAMGAVCGVLLSQAAGHAAPRPSMVRSSWRAQPKRPTLLLLSVDGLMPEQILQSDALGVHVPNLQRIIHEGTYATGVRTVVPSLTYPAHTTLLTGTSPARHGIGANLPFDPMRVHPGQWFWFSRDIRSPTLWDAAHGAHLVTANVTWPVSVGAPVDYDIPQYWGTPSDAALTSSASDHAGWTQDLIDSVGPDPGGADFSDAADEMRARYTEYLIEHEHPTFVTAYWAALDGVEHHTGPSSIFALRLLERIDERIGKMRSTLERVAPGRFVFAVVSDHGFVAYHREIELGALLREQQFIDALPDGTVTDWRAAAWTAGGTAAIILRDPADAATRRAIAQLIETIRADPRFGIDRVFEKPDITALEGFASADFVLALNPGFKFGPRLLGPVLVDKVGGTHGYLPDVPGMDAVFFIVGQGIPKGRSLGRVDMRDVAPTLAALLSLKLPEAEGVNLLAPRRGTRNRTH